MRVFDVLDDLAWMADVHLDLLGETEQSPFHQVPEKGQIVKDLLVGLFQKLCFKTVWKLLDKHVLFLVVELFLDV